ncbi:hypothetical protein NQ314_012752 [Rhamnusium bicolor]|uniref:Reverse transcriptase domain-containing protein n=1 Tax=Rhamnusium bicolor TaxID=1586634 RepID=A0AAV8X999_9CUCU|nr:hypothetical protein NQ314_012752 [Rhamnusium bicolor]
MRAAEEKAEAEAISERFLTTASVCQKGTRVQIDGDTNRQVVKTGIKINKMPDNGQVNKISLKEKAIWLEYVKINILILSQMKKIMKKCTILDNIKEIFHVDSKNNCNPFVVNVNIGSKELEMLIDSGSSVSVISNKTFLNFFSNYRLMNDSTVLRAYDGNVLAPLGYFKTNVTFNEVSLPLKFYVVKSSGPNLLERDWLENFKVKIDVINHMSVDEKIKRTINKYPSVFQNKIGMYKFESVSLEVKEDSVPIFCKHRTIPLAFTEQVEKELDKMNAEEILVPVENSEWATPLVPVLKASGSVRICGDYRITVNKCLKDYKYPLPKVEEVFSKLSKGKKITKLDLMQAYNQIPVTEETSKLLTWNTHKGLFRMTRFPFGITSATSIFQKTIDNLLKDLDCVLAFVDDICITGSNDEDHIENLDKVCQRLEKAGLTVRLDKSMTNSLTVYCPQETNNDESFHDCSNNVNEEKNLTSVSPLDNAPSCSKGVTDKCLYSKPARKKLIPSKYKDYYLENELSKFNVD